MNRLKAEELELLNSSRNEEEWNEVCDMIKADREGQYPGDWFPKVLLSGMADRVSKRWS